MQAPREGSGEEVDLRGHDRRNGVTIESDDAKGRAHVVRYAARAPVALSRMKYDKAKAVVRIDSDKVDGPTAGTHTFDALEFLAKFLAHVPRRGEVYIRYYGAYSVRRRAAWRANGVTAGHEMDLEDETDEPRSEDIPDRVRARRQRWAALLRRIWDVDVETCPSCGGNMEILAFTLDPVDIDATLRELRNKGVDPRNAGAFSAGQLLEDGSRSSTTVRIFVSS